MINAPRKAAYATAVCAHETHLPEKATTTSPSLNLGAILDKTQRAARYWNIQARIQRTEQLICNFVGSVEERSRRVNW